MLVSVEHHTGQYPSFTPEWQEHRAIGKAHLRTRRLPQIPLPPEIHLPPQRIIRMHHLMRQHILQMPAIPHLVRTHQDAMRGLEPAALPLHPPVAGQSSGTPRAADLVRAEALPVVEVGDLVVQKQDGGRPPQQPVAVGRDARDVAGFVGAVAGLAVVEEAFRGDGAGERVEERDPVVRGGIEAGAGRVIFEVEVGGGFGGRGGW